MSLSAGRYRYNGSELTPSDSSGSMPLLVADSWLTIDGRTVALDRHYDRFGNSAVRQGLVEYPAQFLQCVHESLPQKGEWFPRLELTIRGELILWLREAPSRGHAITVREAPTDPRTEPTIKGPDLSALEELRTQTRLAGAEEAIVTNEAGYVVDGASTCLLWWRDGVPYVPDDSLSRVNSVTAGVMRDLFIAHGDNPRNESVQHSQLAETELWALNALHGIRVVTEWIDGPQLEVNFERAEYWRTLYEQLRQA